MVFRIENLPVIGGRRLRSFQIRGIAFYNETVRLRKGMDLKRAAQQLGVSESELSASGIIRAPSKIIPGIRLTQGEEINIVTLKKIAAAQDSFFRKITLRSTDDRNTDNIARIVIARLGYEEDILEFDIISVLRAHPDRDKQIALLCYYFNGFRPDEVPSPENHIARAVQDLYPYTLYAPEIFRVITAGNLYPSALPTQESFALSVARRLYPDEPAAQGKFIGRIAENLYYDPVDQGWPGFMENDRTAIIRNNPVAREYFVLRAAKELYPDNPSVQGEFVFGAAKGLYPDIPAAQGKFVFDAARKLYPDNPTTQKEFVPSAVRSLPGAY